MTAEAKKPNDKPPKSLLQKLHSIMQDVSYIQKDARNAHGQWNYASEKVIKLALHAAFIKYGVLMKLDVEDARVEELETSKQGRETKVVIIKTAYTFYDVTSGDTMQGHFIGCGQGRDDKGIYAAITGAIKYILTSTFLIPTGDDPESDGNNGNNGDGAKQAAPPPAKPQGDNGSPKRTRKRTCAITFKNLTGYRIGSEKEFDDIIAAICTTEAAQSICQQHDIPTLTLPDEGQSMPANDPTWDSVGEILAELTKPQLDAAIVAATAKG